MNNKKTESKMDNLLGLSDYIINKINKAKTMGQLDYMRKEVYKEALSYDEALFYKVQQAFVKKQKSLKQIPKSKRPTNWDLLEEIKD